MDDDFDIAQLARAIPPPWVIKPRSLGASQGVVKVDHPADFAEGLRIARSARQPGMPHDDVVLVEEYVEGSEITVDGYFDGRDYIPLYITRKRLNKAPYFEEMGHTLSGDDEYLTDASLQELMAAAHVALGLRGAISHTEVRITPAGFRVIEVNGRMAGDLVSILVERAMNYNSAWYALELALGRNPGKPAPTGRCCGIRFLRPDEPCVVDSIRFDTERARAAGLAEVSFQAMVQPGAELLLPPENYVVVRTAHRRRRQRRGLQPETGRCHRARRVGLAPDRPARGGGISSVGSSRRRREAARRPAARRVPIPSVAGSHRPSEPGSWR